MITRTQGHLRLSGIRAALRATESRPPGHSFTHHQIISNRCPICAGRCKTLRAARPSLSQPKFFVLTSEPPRDIASLLPRHYCIYVPLGEDTLVRLCVNITYMHITCYMHMHITATCTCHAHAHSYMHMPCTCTISYMLCYLLPYIHTCACRPLHTPRRRAVRPRHTCIDITSLDLTYRTVRIFLAPWHHRSRCHPRRPAAKPTTPASQTPSRRGGRRTPWCDRATLRLFVGDYRPEAVRAVAQDRRLFSAELYLSGRSHAQQPGEAEYPGEAKYPGREDEWRLAEATPVAVRWPQP